MCGYNILFFVLVSHMPTCLLCTILSDALWVKWVAHASLYVDTENRRDQVDGRTVKHEGEMEGSPGTFSIDYA